MKITDSIFCLVAVGAAAFSSSSVVVQAAEQSSGAATSTVPLSFQKLFGKGLVISTVSNGGDTKYWNAIAEGRNSRRITLNDEPQTYVGRFYAVQGTTDTDTIRLRLGDFQYICLNGDSKKLIILTREHVEKKGFDEQRQQHQWIDKYLYQLGEKVLFGKTIFED